MTRFSRLRPRSMMEIDQPDIPVAPDAPPIEAAPAPASPAPPRRRARTRRNAGGGERRGSVGQQIYADVNRIIDAEGISKQEAFARVGAAQGRRTGTVAANYYRVARAERGGGAGTRRARRSPGGRG